MKFINLILMVSLLSIFTGCGEIIDEFTVDVGQNQVTTAANFSDNYALDVDGNFPIDIKGINYGEIFISRKSEDSPFKVGLTASIEAFTNEKWEGFDNVSTLPNGEPLPGWPSQEKLIVADIPDFSPHFDIKLYVGVDNPYYVGIAVTLNILDDHYPEGLKLSQNFKKDGNIWGEVVAFGPTKDSEGNIINHGGLFFLAEFKVDENFSRRGTKKNSQILVNDQKMNVFLKQSKNKKLIKQLRKLKSAIKEEAFYLY